MAKISPLAYIDPEAVIGENCEIGPFCYIDKNVVIGDNNTLMNSVTLLSGTRLGNENTLFPGAVIGAIPQDLKFKGEESTVEIGNGNRIRENVTIHRGTASKGKTTVGNNNLIMAIFTTICCCLPFGIVGIIKATKVDSYYNTGQYQAAQAAANDAKKWSLIGIVVGLVVQIIYLAFYGFAILGNLTESM